MCVVSMIGDHYWDKWRERPWVAPDPYPPVPVPWTYPPLSTPTQQEFDKLKEEVEELKKLLIRAKEYDRENDEPDCEIEGKMKFLKDVARLVGVDLEEYLK